jgi:hypothetical protein
LKSFEIFGLDDLLPLVANVRGDLFQIAAPDTLSNAAKPEITMIELKRFQPPPAKCLSSAFDFERASLALLAARQHRGTNTRSLSMASEWRDPATFRWDNHPQSGGRHHG